MSGIGINTPLSISAISSGIALPCAIATTPGPSATVPNPSLVFSNFRGDELGSTVANLFSVLAHRGCIQACRGCHAGALPYVTTGTWDQSVAVFLALKLAEGKTGIAIQANFPKAALETFRDSDAAHLEFETGQGIGDLSKITFEILGRRTKVMTSGARYLHAGDVTTISPHDISQLFLAGKFAGRMSVSASIETMAYRELGAATYASLLARTFEAMVLAGSNSAKIFIDMMYYLDPEQGSNRVLGTNKNPLTIKTLKLVAEMLEKIGETFLSAEEKKLILDELEHRELDPRGFDQIMLPGRLIGVRFAPHLSTGRGSSEKENSIPVLDTATSDWLPVLSGEPAEEIGIIGKDQSVFATRSDLRDLQRRHDFITAVKRIRGDGILSEAAELRGNWPSFFRTELDLSPPITHTLSGRHLMMSPGVNLGPTANLLVTDLVAGDWQVVIPFKRLII